MKILITGTSRGIGTAIANKFLKEGHEVVGIDKNIPTIIHPKYMHLQKDIYFDYKELQQLKIDNIDILINNAGVQDSRVDIDINLKGTINITELFGIQNNIKSILMIASASAHTGAEFPEYAASKGGMIAYMKNVALRISKYGATCNSLSPGGVISPLNDHIQNSVDLYNRVLAETLLDKWSNMDEIADWAYFVTVINKSMTAQDILIDNGEIAKSNFVW